MFHGILATLISLVCSPMAFGQMMGTTVLHHPAAQISYIPGNSSAGFNSPNLSISLTSVTSGDLLLCWFVYHSTTGQVTSVTDTFGTNFTRVGSTAGIVRDNTLGDSLELWFVPAASSGTDTVSGTLSVSGEAFSMACSEYSGVSVNNPLDQWMPSSGSGATGTVGSVTTTYPRELIFVATLTQSTPTAGGLYTPITTAFSDIAEYTTVNLTGAQSATVSVGSGQWDMIMATFRAAK
jgi:hypothetical protein